MDIYRQSHTSTFGQAWKLVYFLLFLFFSWEGFASQETLRGIVLVSDLSDANAIDRSEIDGLYVHETVLLPGVIDALKDCLAPFCNQLLLDRTLLLNIKNSIVKYFSQYQQRAVYVSIPEQEISSGVVVFEVNQAKIGKVSYQGNRWFPANQVKKALDLQPNQTLDVDRLLNRVCWLNLNPFHHTEVILSPGANPGKTDIEVLTTDRFPLRTFIGGDNTGTEATGTGRYYAGLSWGNAFFVDDIWSYQFSMNQDFHRFSSHNMNYLSFLPCRHILMLSGAYALMHPDIAGFSSSGKDALLSFRYKIPFKSLCTPFQHSFSFGVDYKYFTNILFFIGDAESQEPVMNSQVNVSQAMLGYQLEYKTAKNQALFLIECFGSPAKWLPHQGSHAYSKMRPFAASRYFYFKTSLGEIYTFPSKEAVAVLLRIQGSASTLIPSEQFQLGGYNSVRGYEQSVFISDNAICVNFELRSRPFSFFKKARDALTFLGFLDYGWGYNYHPFDGVSKSASLLGIGPGFRYRIEPYLEVRFDYGFKLHSINFDDNKLGMFHVGVTLGY